MADGSTLLRRKWGAEAEWRMAIADINHKYALRALYYELWFLNVSTIARQTSLQVNTDIYTIIVCCMYISTMSIEYRYQLCRLIVWYYLVIQCWYFRFSIILIHKKYSAVGITIALTYFHSRGHRVTCYSMVVVDSRIFRAVIIILSYPHKH